MKSDARSTRRSSAERADGGARRSSTTADIPSVDSTLLLGPAGRVVIEHRGQRYELRETRFGKLILTK